METQYKDIWYNKIISDITNCFLRFQFNKLLCFVLFMTTDNNETSDITNKISWSQASRYTEFPLYKVLWFMLHKILLINDILYLAQMGLYEAICDFDGEEDDDLNFKRGTVVTVLKVRCGLTLSLLFQWRIQMGAQQAHTPSKFDWLFFYILFCIKCVKIRLR